MNITKLETIILKKVSNSSKYKLYSFNIYKDTLSQMSDFNKALGSLEEKKLIILDDSLMVTLTEAGLNWLMSRKNNKISLDKSWSEIPDKFKTSYKIELDSFYIPNMDLLNNN